MTERGLAERLRLIVITDAQLASPRTVEEVVGEALQAGATAVQLRDKSSGAAELARQADTLLRMCRDAESLFFVNDRLDVALAVGADGVHLGPDDIPVEAVRGTVADSFLIGTSTDDPQEAKRLTAEGADYIGCGTVYETTSKPDAGPVIGTDGLRRVVEATHTPVVGIGGVTVARAPEICETGAAGAAVIGAVMAARDVGATVRGLLQPWHTTD